MCRGAYVRNGMWAGIQVALYLGAYIWDFIVCPFWFLPREEIESTMEKLKVIERNLTLKERELCQVFFDYFNECLFPSAY